MTIRDASGDRVLEQAALVRRIAQASSGLASLGIGPGDSVALMLRNDFPFIEASLAASAIGGYAVPMNWHYRGDEAGYILQDCQAKVLVAHADLLRQIRADVRPGVTVLTVRTPPAVRRAYGIDAAAAEIPPGETDWETWLGGFQPWTAPAVQGPQSMIYTSGTTGRPKGVRRHPSTPEQQAAMLAAFVKCFGVNPAMRTVITGPMYHSAPNAYALYAARAGAEVILQPRFDAEELLQLIERHRISHLHMVPTMFVRLLKLPEAVKRKYDLSSLRQVVHAAAPCPPEVKQAMIEWWGPVIVEYYGATETGIVVYCDSAEWLAHPATVGRALEGCEVKIVGDDGRELGTGHVGEIFVRNFGVSDFTYHGQDAKRQEIDREGLVSVGDVGYLDTDGFLYLCDRKRDMVISGGVNIYPAEIEAVLIGMPGVQDCAIFGIPDEEMGESLAAAIQPHAGTRLEADMVRGWLRQRIAGYKVPKLVEFHAELPREDSGKIFKRKLREPHWQNAGRRI